MRINKPLLLISRTSHRVILGEHNKGSVNTQEETQTMKVSNVRLKTSNIFLNKQELDT